MLPGLVEETRSALERLREALFARERACEKDLSLVYGDHRDRARNLVHYWAYRESDPRHLGESLEQLGLDTLQDVEWNVVGRIDRVLERLSEISGSATPTRESVGPVTSYRGKALLRDTTDTLFGPAGHGRDVRIMVTLPAEADEDENIVSGLTAAGTDCYRINCARDDREAWSRVIDRIKRAQTAEKRPLIFMDLGGSKLRVSSCSGGGRSIRLTAGDNLFISKSSIPASASPESATGDTRREIAVSDPSVLAGLLPGHRVWFDDGKIGGTVRERGAEALRVEITYAKQGGRKLRLERGLNLPDTPLRVPALTEKDLIDLPFAARHADFLALSFIRTPADVEQFLSALGAAPQAAGAIVIKIETHEALEHLPRIMLAAMRHPRVAMLLARGDLAVECGMQEMPRIQEDMLRYCAAAALPLFWCTGVLERMGKTGEPTRAEITDVEVGSRAQCLMLNKGPHVLDAMRLLNELLTRSSADR
jgi:pyruvate kinase